MAKVYLDTNYFIGLANRTRETDVEILNRHEAFVSILSCHILFYIDKIEVPDTKTNSFLEDFNIIEFNQKILNFALLGPTKDLEDNIQLYSATESDCEYFLTNDKELLKMKYFGKTKIVNSLT
jgi:predicted nucleic acid-binding protein